MMIAVTELEVVHYRDFGCYFVEYMAGIIARCDGFEGRMVPLLPKIMGLFA